MNILSFNKEIERKKCSNIIQIVLSPVEKKRNTCKILFSLQTVDISKIQEKNIIEICTTKEPKR